MGKQTAEILGLKHFGIHVKPLKHSRSEKTTFIVVDAYDTRKRCRRYIGTSLRYKPKSKTLDLYDDDLNAVVSAKPFNSAWADEVKTFFEDCGEEDQGSMTYWIPDLPW